MLVRQKARRRPWLIISTATVLTLALLSGAVFFLLPKITAASVKQPIVSSGQGSNGAINSTANTGNAKTTNTAKTVSNAGQVAVQPTQAASTTMKQGSNSVAMGNRNTTQPASAAAANNGNQAPAPATVPHNATVSIVMIKQYVSNIRHTVAQSFNITDKALAQQLQNGMHLKDIAIQHGLSSTQLQNLLSTSILTGFQPAISAGSLTQTQVSTFIQQTQQNPTLLEQQLSILPAPTAHW